MSILAFVDLDKEFKRVERKALTPLQKRGVYVNYDCRCAECGVPFKGLRNVFCFDHTHALCLGGGNEAENFRPLCRTCTLAKNAADARALAKTERMEAERAVSWPVLGLKPDRDTVTDDQPQRAKSRWPARRLCSRPFPERRA